MVLTLDDFEAAARSRLPACLFGYASHGSERGASVASNARSFERWSFVPRTLVDVSSVTQTRSLFGVEYAAPFGIAPMGGCSLFAFDADLALARAAQAMRVPFVLSAASSVPLERVLEQAPGAWYQGYLPGHEERILALLARLEAARVGVLVVTVDVPVASNRDRDRRLGFAVPVRPSARLAIDGLLHPRWLVGTLARTLLSQGIPRLPNFSGDGSGPSIVASPQPFARSDRDRLSWRHLESIRRAWKGRLVVKGVLSAPDARRAVETGADALIVSNHGGRQLDGAIAPLEVLPEIVSAAGSVPVCLDGGIRRGTDVLKALALGAHMVFVGRPMLYALSVQRQQGVEAAIGILQKEIATSLALLGAASLAELDRGHLRQA